MIKILKIVFGCLAFLWGLRSLILLPGALSHAQTAYSIGVVAGLIAAVITAAALTVLLFRSAFRKSGPRDNDAGSSFQTLGGTNRTSPEHDRADAVARNPLEGDES